MSIKSLLIPGLLALAALTLIACSKQKWKEGGIYVTRNEDSAFSAFKVLKVDEGGVHVRLYSNKFRIQPTRIDEQTLYMAGVDHKPDESLGMGHAPISNQSIRTWDAKFIQQSSVKQEELEGYQMWLEAKGGYF